MPVLFLKIWWWRRRGRAAFGFQLPPSGREVTPVEILKLRRKCRQRVAEAGSLADSHRSLKLYAQLIRHIDSNWFRTWAFCHGYRTWVAEESTSFAFRTWAFCHGYRTGETSGATPRPFRTWAFYHGYRTSPSTNNYHLLFRTWMFCHGCRTKLASALAFR